MEFYPMSKILFMVLIVALWLWAFCSMVISIFKPKKEYQKAIKELEKKLKAIKETIGVVDDKTRHGGI